MKWKSNGYFLVLGHTGDRFSFGSVTFLHFFRRCLAAWKQPRDGTRSRHDSLTEFLDADNGYAYSSVTLKIVV